MSVQPIDLVQIKWQQIRVVEASHVTERENIELRKKIREVQSSSARIGGEALKKFMSNFKAYAIKHRLEVTKLKTQFIKDMNDALQLQQTFKAVHDKTLALLEEKEVAYMTSKAENRLQRTQLSAAKHEAQEVAKVHEAEKAKLQAKIDKLMSEKLDNQYNTEKIFAEAAQKQKMYDDLLAAKNKLESQNEYYKAENKRLKEVISSTQSEYNESMQAMQGLLNQHKEESAMNIERLLQDIDYLKNIITEQEEQIQRLSNQLIGNKSHFAKFVEIKSENLNLQAKLDAIMGKTSLSGSRKLRTGGPVQLPYLTHSSSNSNLAGSGSAHASARDNSSSDREEGIASNSSTNNAPPPVAGNPAHMLPAYQRMKQKLAVANSIANVMGSEDVALEDATALLNAVNKSSKSSKLVPTLPLGSSSSHPTASAATATTGVGYEESEYIVSNSPRGHALSAEAFAGGSSSKKKDSARGLPGTNEPHLMVNFKPPQQQQQQQQQQPRPPPVEANDSQRANGAVRKSMRVDNAVASSSPVPQVNFMPDFNPVPLGPGNSANTSSAIQIPRVNVLKSRERVVI